MTLAPHYVAKPKDSTPYFGIYVWNPNTDRMIFRHFAAIYAAKHFVNLMLDGDKPTWDVWRIYPADPGKPMIVTSRGTHIRTFDDSLEEIIEHEFTNEEARWEFPVSEYQEFATFPRLGKAVDETQQPSADDADTPSASPKREQRTPKPVREARPSKEGLITAQDIGTAMQLDPKTVRTALRAAGLPKPAAGWAWPSAEVPDVINAITQHLKPGTPFTVPTTWGNKPLKTKAAVKKTTTKKAVKK